MKARALKARQKAETSSQTKESDAQAALTRPTFSAGTHSVEEGRSPEGVATSEEAPFTASEALQDNSREGDQTADEVQHSPERDLEGMGPKAAADTQEGAGQTAEKGVKEPRGGTAEKRPAEKRPAAGGKGEKKLKEGQKGPRGAPAGRRRHRRHFTWKIYIYRASVLSSAGFLLMSRRSVIGAFLHRTFRIEASS
jgi:hypothetical protein